MYLNLVTIYSKIMRASIFTYLFKIACSGDEPSVDASKAVAFKTRIKAYFILASTKDNQQVQLRITSE